MDNYCDIRLKRSACLVCISVFASLYLSQVMGGLNLMYKCKSFLLLVPLQTYLWQKKNLGIANWPVDSKKQYVFARQLPHTKSYM